MIPEVNITIEIGLYIVYIVNLAKKLWSNINLCLEKRVCQLKS